ncbi:MAG: phosphotransferase [Arthrobacter sp.]|uniref:phosphotransferase family protein n=1 Tax=Arthrobacter sp. TaxID=1667 RepID=UPI0034991F85
MTAGGAVTAGGSVTGGRSARARTARALPELLEIGGEGAVGEGFEREEVRVRRAWPAPDGTQVFEAVDGAGRVRAGAWDGRGAALLRHATDPRLPGLSDEGTVLVHRRGKRAVVRRDTAGGTDYVKALRPGRGPAVAETSRRLAAMALEAGLLAPRVLSAGGDAVRFSALPGMPIAEYAGAASPGWVAAWDLWAGAWPALVATDAGALPVHDAGREAEVLGTWAGHLLAHDPLGLTAAGRARVDARLAAVAGDLERLAAGERPPVTAHRDLHDKQLLYDRGADRLGILDFDTAARADVELDLGNLLAHLELRRDQGVIAASARDSAAARVLGVAADLGADPRRLDAYTEAARLRLVCVYAFRPAWRGLAERWLARGRRTAGR